MDTITFLQAHVVRLSGYLAAGIAWLSLAGCSSSAGPSPQDGGFDAARDAMCIPEVLPCDGAADCDASVACAAGVGGIGASTGSSASTGTSSASSTGSTPTPPLMDASEDSTLDADPSGACTAATNPPSWSGRLTLGYTDTATNTYIVNVMHNLDVTFTLVRSPSSFTTGPALYTGKPMGMGSFNESLSNAQSSETNSGSGAVASIGDMSLAIDTTTCTFQFTWSWGLPATLVIDGMVASMPDPENVGGFHSKDVPLGDWQLGIAYSAGFPTYGGSAGVQAKGDYYALLSSTGAYLSLADPSAARGPADVSFSASADPFPPDQ